MWDEENGKQACPFLFVSIYFLLGLYLKQRDIISSWLAHNFTRPQLFFLIVACIVFGFYHFRILLMLATLLDLFPNRSWSFASSLYPFPLLVSPFVSFDVNNIFTTSGVAL